MSYKNVYFPIKAFALFSFVSVALKYWGPSEVGFYLMLSPYAVLFYLSNASNYRNSKLTIIRGISAGLTLLLVPFLLFGIEPDAQAGIGIMFGLLLQLASISAAELVILFFFNDEQRV